MTLDEAKQITEYVGKGGDWISTAAEAKAREIIRQHEERGGK